MLIVSIGTGAPQRIDSSKKMNCSIGPAALPAVLLGPADAEPAVAPHPPHHRAHGRAGAIAAVQLLADLGREELVVVGAQLAAQRLLLGGVGDVHEPGLSVPS